MTLPDFLSQDADGYIHVTGHRIGLQDVVYYYNEGHSPETLLEAFPTLSLALIHKIIAFYLEHSAASTPTWRRVNAKWTVSVRQRHGGRTSPNCGVGSRPNRL